MLGIAFYNSTLVRKKLEYLVAPLYSFAKGNINGYTTISYTFMPRGAFINTWNLGVKGAKFNSRINTHHPIVYTRLQPYLQMNLTRPGNASRMERFIRADYTQVIQRREQASDTFTNNTTQYLNVQYSLNKNTLLNPYKFKVMLEKNLGNNINDYWKFSLKAQYKLSYENPVKNLAIDFFAGRVFYNKTDNKGYYDFSMAAENPTNDYKYWNAIPNRDPGTNIQIFNEQGGVRSNLIPFNTSKPGGTLRFRSSLPYTNLIRPYFDLGTYKGFLDDKLKLFYTSGISIVLVEDAIEVNFPLAFTHSFEIGGNKQYEVNKNFLFTQSKVFNDALAAGNLNYWQTVTFLLNLDKLNPLFWLRNFPMGK